MRETGQRIAKFQALASVACLAMLAGLLALVAASEYALA
jgi:hypothetical protein